MREFLRFLFFKEESPISRYITAILGFQVSVNLFNFLPHPNGQPSGGRFNPPAALHRDRNYFQPATDRRNG